MLLHNCFHTDDMSHDHIPYAQAGFPYACIETDMEEYPNRCVAWHWHTSCEIVTVTKGEVKLFTPDLEVLMHAGDLVYVNTGVLHTYLAVGTEKASQCAHLFHIDFLSGAFNSIFDEKYCQPVCRCSELQAWHVRPDSRDHMAMIAAVMDAARQMQLEPEGYEFEIRALLGRFWLGLFKETAALRANAPVRNNADQERIKQMIAFIEAHYPETITVQEIGASAGISPRECTRCFQRCIHMTPIEYLTQHRLREAANMLAQTSKTVLQVSEDCGFSSPSYFSRVFREKTGDTPKAYQKKAGD